VTITHLGYPNGEAAAMVATGRVDAVEMIFQGEYFHNEYYRYLNAGYALPLVGGTDKMTAEVPMGIYRTYVRIPPDQPFTYDTWCEGVQLGRTFLSAGPLLNLTVEGGDIGDTVRLPSRGGTLEVEAVARSDAPIHCLQLVERGRVVAEARDALGTRTLTLRARVRVTRNSWIAARVGGPHYFDSRLTQCSVHRGVFAHTSPVYIACGNDWTMSDKNTLTYMQTMIDGCLAYIRQAAPQDLPGSRLYHHGQQDHQAFLEAPFNEATAAVQDRLRRGSP
jgi:hypothetical protein